MSLASLVASLVVAALHVGFFVLESFLWTTPRGRKIFGQSRENAEITKVLAQNQGFYNGGVAALLGWAALTGRADATTALLIFVAAMGLVGAVTAKPSIFFLQSLPAGIALGLLFFT